MKKKLLVGITTAALVIPLCISAAILSSQNYEQMTNANNHTFTLGRNEFANSSLAFYYQRDVIQEFGEDRPVIHYDLAKINDDKDLVLAPSGKVFNYSSTGDYHGRITDITSITVNYYGGQLYVQEGIGGNGLIYDQKSPISSGIPFTFTTNPNYIVISNSLQTTTINSITFSYSCSEAGYVIERFGQKYNGKAEDGETYTLVRDGNNVIFGSYSGTLTTTSAGKITMSLDNGNIIYTGEVSPDYKTLTFDACSSPSAPNIETLNRYYVMDDFEGYSQTGIGFTEQQTSIYTASDLRSAYYADYGGGGNNTWVKDSDFQVPTSNDYLNLTTDIHHNGSKAMLLKGSKYAWMRFWSIEAFNQHQHYNFGKGDRFSFYVHGAYTKEGTTLDSSITIRVQVYYENFVLDNNNRNSTTYGTGTKEFVVAANSDWKEITFNIDPNKSVYAFNIMIANSNSFPESGIFLPIDDLTIHTNPVYNPPKTYEETSTKITKTYHGSLSIDPSSLIPGMDPIPMDLKVGLGTNGYIYAYAGVDMKPTDYTISGNTITISTTGNYFGKNFGDWVGTLSNNNSTIVIPKSGISGDITDFIIEDAITLVEDNILADGNIGFDKIKRQKQTNGWTDDGELTSSKEYYVEGNSSIHMQPDNSVATRITAIPSVFESEGVTFSSISFWFYVPAGVYYYLEVYSYLNYELDNNYKRLTTFESDGSDVSKTGWRYLNLGLSSANKNYNKNFSIRCTSTSAQTYIDNITYY